LRKANPLIAVKQQKQGGVSSEYGIYVWGRIIGAPYMAHTKFGSPDSNIQNDIICNIRLQRLVKTFNGS
jgi:hypothetical protein